MKFIADNMLGSLARWLRILGYDVTYPRQADDNELVRLARAEGRILLTRDVALARRRGLRAFLIESKGLEEQIRQVVRHWGPPPEGPFSRCPVCNTPLHKVDKEEVKSRVPPYVFRTQENFHLCPGCGRVYWPGTHWNEMRRKIAALQEGRAKE